MQAEGRLSAGLSAQDLSKCVYGRTNPALYAGRPKVSFLMQYFKRPWAIQPLVASLVSHDES